MTSKEALKDLLIMADYLLEKKEQKQIKEEYNLVLKDLERLEKLEKVIENIKQLPKCEVCDDNWIKGCMCFRKKLKEVLGDE